MNIAVDAMGGDHGPAVVVPGAIAGAKAFDTGITLVGREADVHAELAKHDTAGLDISVVHASETIEMNDHAAQSVRRKRDSSIVVALQLVKDGKADAMLSAGNSGAAMAGALMVLGRIKGIDRPAITGGLPNASGRHSLMLDIGAVTDPKPVNMVQNALMGAAYAEAVMGIPNPRVGLVSNGEEESKGNQLVLEVHSQLKSTPAINFVGNIEGRDILVGTADVCVMDGFTGNVVLKTIEGTATLLMGELKKELTASPWRKVLAGLLKPAFRAVNARLDYASFGGAPLLGCNGTVIISHGRSNETAIENAVGAAVRAAEHDLVAMIRSRAEAALPTPNDAQPAP